MGQVISLDEARNRRRPGAEVRRLDAAVRHLDRLVRDRPARLSLTLERELRSIADAVAGGHPGEAAERAERLVGLLEHPAASGT